MVYDQMQSGFDATLCMGDISPVEDVSELQNPVRNMAPLNASFRAAQKTKDHGSDFLLSTGHDCAISASRNERREGKSSKGSLADSSSFMEAEGKARRRSWLTRMFTKAGCKSSKDVTKETTHASAVKKPSSEPQSNLLPGVPKPWHGVRMSEDEKKAKVDSMKEELWRMVGEGQQSGSLKVMRRLSTEPSYFLDN
eukprot:2344676-Rhodomonas_salina.2